LNKFRTVVRNAKEIIMRLLLFLLPVGCYLIGHSSLWSVLRGLPRSNQDFGEFY
jgi:hypothetical protein